MLFEMDKRYKISEINCALGYSQIKKLDKFNKKREKLKKIYISKLSKVPGINFQEILRNSLGRGAQ